MDRIVIENITNVAEIMYEDIMCYQPDNEYEIYNVNFIGYYDDAIKVIKALAKYDDTYIHQVAIEPVEWDGYDKEYLVTLDTDLGIWCEKCQRENGEYLELDDGLVLIADDCNSAILKCIYSDDVYEVSYNFAEDADECETNCKEIDENDDESLDNYINESIHMSFTKEGKLAGFSKSWCNQVNGINCYSSYSHYGDNEEAVKKHARELGIDI